MSIKRVHMCKDTILQEVQLLPLLSWHCAQAQAERQNWNTSNLEIYIYVRELGKSNKTCCIATSVQCLIPHALWCWWAAPAAGIVPRCTWEPYQPETVKNNICFNIFLRHSIEKYISQKTDWMSAKVHCMRKFTCFADGVMPIWTTIMALVMFCSCIFWQYILIVFMPTFGSSVRWTTPLSSQSCCTHNMAKGRLLTVFKNSPGKNTNIWSVGSSLWATNTVRSVRLGRPSLGLSPNWPLKSSSVWSNSSWVTRYPLSWHSCVCEIKGSMKV